MNVSILNFPDSECDDFVRGTADAKLCHMPAWTDMVERVFGQKSFYLVARESGTVCGILPLTYVRCRVFGRRMISQAFSNYGGPLIKSSAALEALYKRAVELATEHGCGSIELRNIEFTPCNFHYLRTDKVVKYLPLTSDPAELWRSFRPQIRNRVRKAEKSGIIVVRGGLGFLEDFYRVWTTRMHQLGTPCYPHKLFSGIMETFPDKCQIFLAHLNDTIVGAIFAYYFNGLVQTRWGAALVEYNNLAPMSLLIWSVCKHYCEAKVECLDLGTSTLGSSQQAFKKRWGSKPIQLHYQYWTRPGREFSLAKPDSPKYKKLVQVWKRLPLWMTRLVGPKISRHLP